MVHIVNIISISELDQWLALIGAEEFVDISHPHPSYSIYTATSEGHQFPLILELERVRLGRLDRASLVIGSSIFGWGPYESNFDTFQSGVAEAHCWFTRVLFGRLVERINHKPLLAGLVNGTSWNLIDTCNETLLISRWEPGQPRRRPIMFAPYFSK